MDELVVADVWLAARDMSEGAMAARLKPSTRLRTPLMNGLATLTEMAVMTAVAGSIQFPIA